MGVGIGDQMRPGEIISYLEMCQFEGASLQRGMNFHLSGAVSVILMSTRDGAPYEDRIEEDGRVLIYEGHDVPRTKGGPDPKSVDQVAATGTGSSTQNGLFFAAARRHAQHQVQAELVRVYEKMRSGIWVFNGTFSLRDAWTERSSGRQVFKFRLELSNESQDTRVVRERIDHTRLIPSAVKREVWKRDGGRCVQCGSTDHLHFDHVIPFSKGGASIVVENIQLLCARHNLEKRDRIE